MRIHFEISQADRISDEFREQDECNGVANTLRVVVPDAEGLGLKGTLTERFCKSSWHSKQFLVVRPERAADHYCY